MRIVIAMALATLFAACAGGAWAGGIHARLAFSDARGLRVLDLPAESVAARAGLEAGDRIVEIDGEPVDGRSMQDVVASLRGPVGTTVRLRIMRGTVERTLEIERAPYHPN